MTTNAKKLNIPIKDQVEFIEEFKCKRPDYEDFAVLMQIILQKAIGELGLMGFAEARAKNLVSFSNKIILKDKYRNPLADMTDLCGARIVVHFKSQVDKVCNFIKKNFEIDEANSLDLKSKLMVNEFGYRSIHYIVSPKKDSILGVNIEHRFKTLKAEIQVRTFAEHIWADISHDRIYKTDLNIPDEWKREAAQLSAMLENADKKFAGMASEIDSLATVYELQFENEKTDVDILKLKTVISVLKDNNDECIKNSLKLSALYRAKDCFTEAVELLEPLLDKPVKNKVLNLKLRFEYGMVITMSCGLDTENPFYVDGTRIIDKVLDGFDQLDETTKKENEEALSYIYYRAGKLFQRNSEEKKRVAVLFTKAHNIMPENPLFMVALMESLVLDNLTTADYNISLFNTNMINAIPKLKELIGIGIKRLPAYFAIGHCYLLLNNEEKCINAFANAAETILCGKYLNSLATTDAEITLLGKMKNINAELAEEAKLYLNIAMHLVSASDFKTKYKNSICKYRINKTKKFKTPVVIIAGGASMMDESKVNTYSKYLREFMHGFKGTIISGGTTAGIPGLTGKIKAELVVPAEFELNAYLPEKLPSDAVRSEYYDNFYETPSGGFSALDVLVCWADLICNDIKPQDVLLVGIDGGKIATMEYKIALSLGAKVALMAYSGRAVSDFVEDKTWKNHRNLLILPNDPLTLWALVNQTTKTILSDQEIKELAPQVHGFYRDLELGKFKSNTEDINKYKVLMPWDNLNPMLQNSNLKQVAFYELILKRVGLSIRKTENPIPYNIETNLSKTFRYYSEELDYPSEVSKGKSKVSDYEMLARLEHARWNAERLLEGWRYGSVKDIAKKLNPCIKAWKDLGDDIKKYDYDPVRNIPVLLAKIGYEVYKEN
jgi:ppGpp synthetase/RelA/SpoT-type nucleotidyltranferase